MSESVQVGLIAGFESIDDGQHFACGEVEGCEYWDAVDCGWGFEEGWVDGEVELDGVVVAVEDESAECWMAPDGLE